MEFYEWLEKYPTRKKNLSHWEQLRFFFNNELDYDSDYEENTIFVSYQLYQITSQWDREEKFSQYWEIFKEWLWIYNVEGDEDYSKEYYIEKLEKKLPVYDNFVQALDEVKDFKFQIKDLQTKLNFIKLKLSQWTNLLRK